MTTDNWIDVGLVVAGFILAAHVLGTEQKQAEIKRYCADWGGEAQARQGEWGCVRASGHWQRVDKWQG